MRVILSEREIMDKKNKGLIIGAVVAGLLLLTGIGSYNGLVKERETVESAINTLESQYQRRSDLVPNLVATVKGSANFEEKTLTKVIEARAKATQVSLNMNDLTEENLAKYQAAQNQLSSSLSRLMAVAENYPELKSTKAFQDLMPQLEGTENRIQVARADYGEIVKKYNSKIKSFPTNLMAGMFGFKEYPYFKSDSNAVPKIEFNFN